MHHYIIDMPLCFHAKCTAEPLLSHPWCGGYGPTPLEEAQSFPLKRKGKVHRQYIRELDTLAYSP